MLALALALSAAAACSSEEGDPRAIEAWRSSALLDRDFKWGATSAERFRLQPSSAMPAAVSAAPSVRYELPAGWRELPASSLRQANFLVASDERAECYLTVLPGSSGGLLANINRWRKQMSLAPLDEAEAAALPRAEFFGGSATRVDFAGTWSGMSGDASGSGYRLVGLLLVDQGSSKFLKMVGPESVIGSALAEFDALAASFHMDESPAHDPHAGLAGAADPHAGMARVPSHAASTSGLTWSAPEDWQRGPERQMREVTFWIGTEPERAECYVACLSGTGGGVLNNVNRWRGQMGAAPLSEAEFGELEHLPMFATDAVLLEVDGAFTGMAGETVSDARLYGAICMLADRSVFVKLIGPVSLLEDQREAFLEFCRSLSFGG